MTSKPPVIALVLGSGPNATECRDWARAPFSSVVAINNAWRLRKDWTHLVCPDDFPQDRRPTELRTDQTLVTSDQFVPAQNRYGGFVYAGGTMAFTAGYWALATLRPDVLAFWGCDMVYPKSGRTHFYGYGQADPLRPDVTLRNLEAKSARLWLMAARDGCQVVNLSRNIHSRLLFPVADRANLVDLVRQTDPVDLSAVTEVMTEEARLDYFVPSGRYWQQASRFDTARLDALDQMWLRAYRHAVPVVSPRRRMV